MSRFRHRPQPPAAMPAILAALLLGYAAVLTASTPAPLLDLLAPDPAPPDAALTPEGERKAEALASFAAGLLLEQEADTAGMIEAFQRAVDLDPGNTLLAERLAYEYVRVNDVPSGIGVLKDAIVANPGEPRLLLHLAMLYSRSLGKHDRALQYARDALAMDPSNTQAFETIMVVTLASGDSEAGRRVVRETLKLEEATPEFWIGSAQVAARLLIPGLDPQKAPPADVDLVGQLFDRALDAAAGNLDIVLAVADFRQRRGEPEAAAALLERILSDDSAELPLRVAARDRLVHALLTQGRRGDAIAQLEALVAEAPLQRDAYDFLGQLYEESGQPERALASYEQVLLLRPEQPMPYLRAADLHVQLGRPEQAVSVLLDARRAFPDLPQLTYSLAIAYSQAERHDLALSTFDLAIREGRNTGEEVATASFFFNYGVASDKAGETKLAIENFRRAAAMSPETAAPALNYMGYMMILRGGDLDEAEKAIRRALELDPNNGAYLDSMGWLHYHRGNYRRALEFLLRAEKAMDADDPSNYEILDHLGDTHEKLGETGKAMEYWRRAAALAPDNGDIRAKIDAAAAAVGAPEQGADGSQPTQETNEP